jgi:hypothetical protein
MSTTFTTVFGVEIITYYDETAQAIMVIVDDGTPRRAAESTGAVPSLSEDGSGRILLAYREGESLTVLASELSGRSLDWPVA